MPGAMISSRGKCAACGEARVREAVSAMHSKEGETWRKYCEGMLRHIAEATGGRVLVSLPGDVQSGGSRSDVA